MRGIISSVKSPQQLGHLSENRHSDPAQWPNRDYKIQDCLLSQMIRSQHNNLALSWHEWVGLSTMAVTILPLLRDVPPMLETETGMNVCSDEERGSGLSLVDFLPWYKHPLSSYLAALYPEGMKPENMQLICSVRFRASARIRVIHENFVCVWSQPTNQRVFIRTAAINYISNRVFYRLFPQWI